MSHMPYVWLKENQLRFAGTSRPFTCNYRSRGINASRLEAIAIRLEATIAIRLEAIIAIRLERPSLLGWRPSLLGWRKQPGYRRY